MSSAFGNPTELTRRIAFTLGALVIYRLGTYIPMPGIDPRILVEIIRSQQRGLVDLFDIFSGGAFGRLSIGAIGIYPYLQASFFLLIVTSLSSRMKMLLNGERLILCTRFLAVVFTALQAYGIAVGLERSHGGAVGSLVADPGWVFRVTAVAMLTGYTAFLIWLAEQITQRGIGNGVALIFVAVSWRACQWRWLSFWSSAAPARFRAL
jgi:preprotein translocase subunit SecY